MIQIDNFSINPSKVLKVERFSNKVLVHMQGMELPVQVTEWTPNPLFITTLDGTLEINPAHVALIHQTGMKKVIYMIDGSRTVLPDEIVLVFPALPTPEAPVEEPVYSAAGDVLTDQFRDETIPTQDPQPMAEPTMAQVMTDPAAIGGYETQSITMDGVLSPVTYVPPKAVKTKPAKK